MATSRAVASDNAIAVFGIKAKPASGAGLHQQHNAIAVFGIKAKRQRSCGEPSPHNAIAVFGIKAKHSRNSFRSARNNAIAVFGIKAKLLLDGAGQIEIMPLPFLESRQSKTTNATSNPS